jgi:hypothetical protein
MAAGNVVACRDRKLVQLPYSAGRQGLLFFGAARNAQFHARSAPVRLRQLERRFVGPRLALRRQFCCRVYPSRINPSRHAGLQFATDRAQRQHGQQDRQRSYKTYSQIHRSSLNFGHSVIELLPFRLN